MPIVAKAGVVGAFVVALGLAVLLLRLGAPVGVAATVGVLLVGLALFLAGRAATNRDPDGATGPLLVVPGAMMLFVTAVSCLLLGKEYWPRANALLLFAGGLAAVAGLCALGVAVVDRLVRARPSTSPDHQVIDATSSEESRRLAREFFGDGG